MYTLLIDGEETKYHDFELTGFYAELPFSDCVRRDVVGSKRPMTLEIDSKYRYYNDAQFAVNSCWHKGANAVLMQDGVIIFDGWKILGKTLR